MENNKVVSPPKRTKRFLNGKPMLAEQAKLFFQLQIGQFKIRLNSQEAFTPEQQDTNLETLQGIWEQNRKLNKDDKLINIVAGA